VRESILTTEAEGIRDFLRGLSGTIQVTFEEGTPAGWLDEVVKPVVAEVVVCHPRTNKLLAVGSKGDRVEAPKLAELLRGGQLKSVYPGGTSSRQFKELVHNSDSLVSDTTRVMNRIKAIYRGRAIRCAGRDLYYPRHRDAWLEQLDESGVRRRAELLYQELDPLRKLRREAKQAMAERIATPFGLPDPEADSGAGTDSDGGDPGEGGLPTSVPDEASVLGLLWVGGGDTVECGP
jgi:hypothetical protein